MYLNNEKFSFLIQRVVRTMGMDTVAGIDGNTHFIKGDGWYICWPEGQESHVIIGFDDEVDPNDAASISLQFCKILDVVNVQVFVGQRSILCDSTATIGFTATIN